MRWIEDLWFRLRALSGRRRMQDELDEEFAFHLEMETRKLEAEGMSPAEARREAHVRFGGVERQKERAREAWGVTALHDLGADARYGIRQILKRPAFSSLAALTLALGIGGTVALGTVAHSVLLRPLPVEDEGRIVTFWSDYNWRGSEFDWLRERTRAFEGLAAWSNNAFTLRDGGASTWLLATVASAELFDVLGARPLLGRTFRPGDDRPGSEPIVVLSHGLWQQEFGGDPGVVGRRVLLDGEPTTVVGVMPEGFWFPSPEMRAWVPLDLDPSTRDYGGNGWLVLTGRLRDGVGPEAEAAELASLTAALGERFTYPEAWDKTKNAFFVPLREYLLGDVRPAVLLLLGAVGTLLVLACANVAALILTRTADRAGEMSVRAALGAGRTRLARQVLTESVLLGLLGGGAGLAFALALFDVIVASLPLGGGLAETLTLEWPVLLAALAISVAVGAVISLAPIRGLLSGDVAGGAMGERRQSGLGTGPARMQKGLVVAEVLLAVVLATGAALLVRSVDRLQAIDPGLDPDGVLAVDVYVGEQETDASEREAFLRGLVERAEALPEVEAAGLINRLPIRDGGYQGPITIQDRPDLTGLARPNSAYRLVTPGTFAALGAEIVDGRGIEAGDRAGTLPVAVVNESFAARMWPGERAIGKRIGSTFAEEWFEVVGVVKNVAVHDLVSQAPMAAYYAWEQAPRGLVPAGAVLVSRTGGSPAALAPALRRAVAEIDGRAAVGTVETMREVVRSGMQENVRLRFFLSLFAALGLLLGTVGVYGVVSYGVERRRTELGVRMALGARPGRLVGDIVRTGMVPVVLGILGGAITALALSRVLAGFLFEIETTDPASLLSGAGALLVAGVLAALVPALRASATDPAVALRAE